MRLCQWCKKEFSVTSKQTAKKFCTFQCSDKAQWEKRKFGLTGKRTKDKFISTGFFDWREYPYTILI